MKSPFEFLSALGLVAIVALAAPAAAQTRDDVLFALERTDELIARAQEIVAGTDNRQAEAEIGYARDLQGRARSAFDAGHLGVALDLTRRARLHAEKAIAIVRGLPDPDRVLVQLERTRELLERARDRIEECGNDRARALLKAAFEMQMRAEAAAREGRYLAALQLTTSARERAHRALRICRMEDDLRQASERALARTDELIARAREVLDDHDGEPARRALHRAVELQTEAWSQFRAERFEACLRLTQSARTFAHRAIRLARAR